MVIQKNQNGHVSTTSQTPPKTGKTLVTFTSSPPGETTVVVDGMPICHQTPCTENLEKGSHKIQFLRKKYLPIEEQITIELSNNMI